MTYSAPPRRPDHGSGRPFGEPQRPVAGRARRDEASARSRSATGDPLPRGGGGDRVSPSAGSATRVGRTGALVAQPIRHPDERDPRTMGRRAWWLAGLNLLIPGSAQALAGNRRLGKVGLAATLIGWLLVIVAIVLLLANRAAALTVVTTPWVLLLAEIIGVAYLVLWVVLTVDTIRLLRLPRLPPAARIGVPAATLVVLLALVGVGGYGVTSAEAARGAIGTVFAGGAAVAPIDGRYNILLLGGDDGADRQGLRPDSVTVASVDASTGQTVLIGLPRDLMGVPFPADSPMHALFPDGFKHCQATPCQLNSIYTEVSVFHPDLYPDAVAEGSRPGWEATKDAAEAITGLQIQFLVTVDMAGFQQLVDALGGVTIDVQQRLPIGGQRDDLSDVKAWIEPGVQHMDGNTALWYARSRHSTSDYDRMNRQKDVEEAVLRQFDPTTVVTKFQGIAQAGSQVLSTTVPQSMIGTFIDLAIKAKDTKIQRLDMTPANQVDPARPDWDYIRSLIGQAVGQASASPAP